MPDYLAAASSAAMSAAVEELAKVKAEIDILRHTKAIETKSFDETIAARKTELADLDANIKVARQTHDDVLASMASLRKKLA
jgi:hypothetical protein